MTLPDYNSPAALKALLDENGMAMQKKFGQNFLINEGSRKALVDSLAVQPEMEVWEVGPGLGAMTALLLQHGVRLTAFELDHGFARLLSGFFAPEAETGAFTLVEGDVLKTWQGAYAQARARGKLPARFFGNLPYNIAATIIADTIEHDARFERAVVTVQKEVGQRMCAVPKSDAYSSFSVLCQWAYTVQPLMDLAGGCFWPRPNVESRALVLTRRDDFPRCNNPALFTRLTHALFANRRKTVRNNIQPLLPPAVAAEALFSACDIAPNERAENLRIEKLLALSDLLNSAILEKGGHHAK